jgi:hypothetical protein
VGNPLNWQGQPYEQLQFANSRALIDHFTSVIATSHHEPADHLIPSSDTVLRY